MQTTQLSRPPRAVIACVAVAVLSTAGAAVAQERRITRAQLPKAVEATVAQQSAGATIRGFSQERENGQTLYEAELTVDGHSRDLLMDETGAIVEIEEEVALGALPAEVRSGLQARAGKGKILHVESITKAGAVVAYEAVVQSGGKRREVQVGPDGKQLAHEE